MKIIEQGYLEVLKIMGMTMIVIGCSYIAMNSFVVESFFLAFPEAYLILIALLLLIGKWVGIRLTEYNGFRGLVRT